MKRTPWLAALTAAAMVCGTAGAQPNDREDPGAYAACKDDVQKFCKDVQPGGGRIIGCLKEHREEVSDACKARLAQMRVRKPKSPQTPPPPAPVPAPPKPAPIKP